MISASQVRESTECNLMLLSLTTRFFSAVPSWRVCPIRSSTGGNVKESEVSRNQSRPGGWLWLVPPSLCSSKDLKRHATTGVRKLVISCHTIMCDDRILQTDVVNRETMYSHFAYYATKTT